MRYLNRYERIKNNIYTYKYVDKIQQLSIYNGVKGSLKFNYNHQFNFYNQKNSKLHLCFMKKNIQKCKLYKIVKLYSSVSKMCK